jgi:SAM-dependent methyltransferase
VPASVSEQSLEVVWHDLECAGYREDLPLWRKLAHEAGGPVLEIGAGAGRVSLDLAAAGFPTVALDSDAALLSALRRRSSGLPVETVAADARDFALGRRFALVLVPMQALQLLGGQRGREAFLRCALDHLSPGGLLVAAMADAIDCFDEEHALPPRPDACEIDGVRYSSRLLAVTHEDGRAAIHRRREVVGPGSRHVSESFVLRIDRVSPDEVAAEAAGLGFSPQPHLRIPETEEYLGSTVVALRAP